MKKLFATLVVVSLLGSELFAGGYIVGTIAKVSTRADGTFWVSMKRQSNGALTGLYKFSGNTDALKAMQAVVLSAKVTSAPIRLYYDNKQWHRAELLP